MEIYKRKMNPFTGTFDYVKRGSIISIEEGVATFGDLPSSGNADGDARIVSENHHLYIWTGDGWKDQGDIFDIKWATLEDKPTSAVEFIDDAVSRRHEQGTDTQLGEMSAGINMNFYQLANLSVPNAAGAAVRQTAKITEVSLEDAVDKKHDKLHEINNTLNHLGISGSGIEDNFMALDVNGLPKNSGKSAIDFANASHNHVELDITDLDHYTSEDFSDDFGLSDLANLGTKSYNDLTDKPDLSDLHFHANKVELDLVTDGNHDVRIDNPHIVTVDQLDLSSGTVASDVDDAIDKKHAQNTDVALRTDKLTVDTNGNTTVVGELKIKVFAQALEPTLNADEYMAIWKDTDDANRVYLLFRRGVGDQVAVELA